METAIRIIGHTTESEEFKCDQDRGDRAVGNTAEKCCHSGGRTDGWGKPDQMPHETSECCADAERRNNLTTRNPARMVRAVSTSFPEKVQRTSLSISNGKLDQVVAGTHVISRFAKSSVITIMMALAATIRIYGFLKYFAVKFADSLQVPYRK